MGGEVFFFLFFFFPEYIYVVSCNLRRGTNDTLLYIFRCWACDGSVEGVSLPRSVDGAEKVCSDGQNSLFQ